MATAAKEKSALVQQVGKKEVAVEVSTPSRREFLYYIWGASMVMLVGEAVAGIVWYALPRFKEGEFGGVFNFTGDDVPTGEEPPLSVPSGRMHLSNTEDGFLALYGVCTHLGCLPKWVDGNNRFECPCHGSKFTKDGHYIEGPAPRGLDRFSVQITFTDGSTASGGDGDPVPLNGRTIESISVDSGNKITGPPH